MVNVMTAVAWFTFYFAERNMEPAVVSAVADSLGPIVTLVFAGWLGINSKRKGGDILSSLGVLGSMCLLIGATWFGKGALASFSRDRILVGIVTAHLVMTFSCLGVLIRSNRFEFMEEFARRQFRTT